MNQRITQSTDEIDDRTGEWLQGRMYGWLHEFNNWWMYAWINKMTRWLEECNDELWDEHTHNWTTKPREAWMSAHEWLH